MFGLCNDYSKKYKKVDAKSLTDDIFVLWNGNIYLWMRYNSEFEIWSRFNDEWLVSEMSKIVDKALSLQK